MAFSIRSSGLAGSLSEKRMYGLGAETPGTLHIGVQGKQGEPGVPGPRGPAGQDGITPTIGENGNWFIGDFDTGLPSRGKDGKNVTEEEIEAAIAKYFEENPPSAGDVSLTGYAKEEWVNQNFQPKGNYLTQVPSGYATEQFVTNKIQEAQLSGGTVAESGDFYASLSAAFTDINNGTNANTVSSVLAKVKVFSANNGRTTVMLLDNVEEGSLIDINKNTDLVLNGKILRFTSAGAYLNYGSNVDCTINGEVDGSAVEKIVSGNTSAMYAINARGVLRIIGGRYYTEADTPTTNLCIRVDSTSKELTIDRSTVSLRNTCATSGNHYSRAIQNQGQKTVINDSEIRSVSVAGFAIGIVNTSTVYLNNSTVKADAIDCHATGYNSMAVELRSGTCYIDNCVVYGTHSGIQNKGNLYVNGGTYTGFCHGGIYFAQGSSGVVCINDATFRAGNYEGEFDYSGKTADIYGAFYVGGSSDGVVNMDNCTIDGTDCTQGVFVMRSGSGETNNTVNISNSDIVNGTIRIDPNSNHRVNIGMGCNFTPSNTTTPADAVETNDLYRRNYAGKDLDGNDYDALLGIVEISTPVRGYDYWTAADIAEIKSYVDDSILGGAW